MSVFTSNIDRDGETRAFAAHGHAVIASAGGLTLLKGIFEPGWRWSNDVAPLAGTSSCQIRHLGYVISGQMHVSGEDGLDVDFRAGDLFDLAPGHDAWVVGDEPCVMIDTSPESTRYTQAVASGSAVSDANIDIVRRGYAAFNQGDVETLRSIMANDVVHSVPGSSEVAGEHKGIDAVLNYYRTLGEMTDGTFRADLIDVHGDSRSHVTAIHQVTATRNGNTRVSRGSILFTFLNGKAVELLELRGDLAGDDAFFA